MLFWIATSALAADAHTWPQSVDHLDLQNAAGDVHVEADGDRISVELVPIHDEGCTIEIGDRGGAARVEIKNKAPGSRCQINVVVHLPETASTKVALGAGDVHLVGVGPLDLDVGAGSVKGSVVGEATVQVGAGNVTLTGLTAPIKAQVGAGEVRLAFDTAPTGRVEVASGVGAIDVDLPDGAAVGLDGTREKVVSLRIDAEAPTIVAARTGVGQVSVH